MKTIIKCTLIYLLCISGLLAQTIKGIKAEASLAIVNINPVEAQQMLLRRVRANAIEKASGIEVTSTTLIKDGALAMDFLKSYTSGIIIKEKITWLPVTTYQLNETQAPIPEYHIRIVADIKLVTKTTDLHFFAKLNKDIFISGENLTLSLLSSDDANFAIFYLGEDDSLYKLVPSMNETMSIKAKQKVLFPSKESEETFTLQALKGHKQTTEALWILASKVGSKVDFSKNFLKDEYTLNEFSILYAEIAHNCTETILPYIILEK